MLTLVQMAGELGDAVGPWVAPEEVAGQLPPLQVGNLPAALLPLADIGPIEEGRQRSHLLGGEAL
ncbi:MAG: hypothetical protein ACK5FE_02090 [Cyanobacteriota bacterium]